MNGYTTGTCATAAAFLAATRLLGQPHRDSIPVKLPDGKELEIPVLESGLQDDYAWASVRKNAGGDPDITDKAVISTRVSRRDHSGVAFFAGKGVGTVTRAGLQIPPGNAAINPVPRRMISDHLLALAPGWDVTISVENGEQLAMKTFNPRLGIVGGISIIGTTGIVRPFSHESQLCSIRCALGVARAADLQRLVLVPGHYGERSAKKHYQHTADPGLIEVGNDWGFALGLLKDEPLTHLLIVGHAGKLAKLATGQWDTHSSRSSSALPWILAEWKMATGMTVMDVNTVEGFAQSIANHPMSGCFWFSVAQKIADAIRSQVSHLPIAVSLCDMQGELIAESEGANAWK